jgi:hypothetical protein
VEELVAYSRKHFATEREKIEVAIRKWTNKDFNLDIQRAKQTKENVEKPKPVEKLVEKKDDKEQKEQTEREERTAKELQKIIKEVEREEKMEKKKDDARKKAFLNLQKIHALQTNKNSTKLTSFTNVAKNAKDSPLDEVPEDVLRALLDMKDL